MAEKTKNPLSDASRRVTMGGFSYTLKVLKACKVN